MYPTSVIGQFWRRESTPVRRQAGNTTATAKNVGLSLKLTLDRPQPAGRIPSLQQSGRHISDISNSKNDLVLTVRADLASWQRTR